MGPRGLLCLMLLCNTANAGMDFTWGNKSMTSEEFYKDYKLPDFDNKESAIIWAHRTGYVEQLKRLLRHKMDEMQAEAAKTANDLDPLKLKRTAYFMSKWEDYKAAYDVMVEYKKRKDVGAVIYTGSEPILQYHR